MSPASGDSLGRRVVDLRGSAGLVFDNGGVLERRALPRTTSRSASWFREVKIAEHDLSILRLTFGPLEYRVSSEYLVT